MKGWSGTLRIPGSGDQRACPSPFTPPNKSRSVCTKSHGCSWKTRNGTERAERRSGIFKAPRADMNQFLRNRVRTEENKVEVERKSKNYRQSRELSHMCSVTWAQSRVLSHWYRKQTKNDPGRMQIQTTSGRRNRRKSRLGNRPVETGLHYPSFSVRPCIWYQEYTLPV